MSSTRCVTVSLYMCVEWVGGECVGELAMYVHVRM